MSKRNESEETSEEMVGGRYTRSDFLKGLGAAGVGAAVGSNALLGDALARPSFVPKGQLEPTDLTFSIVERYRNFALIGANFVELSDSFGSDSSGDYEILTPAPEDNGGEVAVGNGDLKVSGGEAYFNLFRSQTSQRAPFASVIVDVESFANSSSGPEDTVFAGLVKDDENYVVAFYNDRKKLAGIDVVVDGQVNTVGTESADLSAPTRFAFTVTENKVTALAEVPEDDRFGWRPLLRGDVAEFIDLRRPAVLDEYRNGFGVRANSGATITLGGVEAGYFGEAGTRDPHVVTYADGTPYIKDGKVYLTFTQAGLAFFETAHWGVWSLDLSSYELEQVSNLFFMRDDLDAVLGDHAGHIVVDEDNDRFILAMSTWGDFSFEEVDVNYATVPLSENVLSGVHVLQTQSLPLPLGELSTATVGQWDPHLVRIGKRWYVTFVNARRFFNFYPVLAKSGKGEDFTDLGLVGADTRKVETEGTILQKIGGEWYVFASNGDNSPPEIQGRYPVYDLDMNQIGALDAPHPTQIPHPMLFPVPEKRGRTRYVMVTFNIDQYFESQLGYGTHGDFFVMEAAETTRGYEFPPGG